MKKRLFGTSGIRGTTNREITPELCLKVAQAFGTWVRRTGKPKGKIGIARDTRYGATVLADAAAAGLAAAGHDVVHFDILPAGGFSVCVRAMLGDGGIMITGSHMPYDRIGLMLVLPDGTTPPFDVTDVIEEIFRHGPLFHVRPEEIGTISHSTNPDRIYLSEVLARVDLRLLQSKRFKVLVDPANGAGSALVRETLEKAGCEVVNVNTSFQPVPARPSEPRAENVEEARNICKVMRVDLGLCLDVDADRALFIDKNGAVVSEDAAGAILAHAELKPGDVLVAPVNCSALVEWIARRAGAKLEYSRIGQPEIVRVLRETSGAFAYEESGKYYFARTFPWSDGIYSGLRMLETMARERKSLSELVEPLPKFHQGKGAVRVEDEHRDRIMEEVLRRMKLAPAPENTRDVVIDGFKRIFPDGSWLMVRSSGTEPLIRIYSDATRESRARELLEEGRALVQRCLREAGLQEAGKPQTSLFPRPE
jgi:phosphomannomutase/phosphoglucomutase